MISFSLPKLLGKIKTNKIDGAFRKEIERVELKHLLILDDWGLTPLDTQARLALLQIIEAAVARTGITNTQQSLRLNYQYRLGINTSPTTPLQMQFWTE